MNIKKILLLVFLIAVIFSVNTAVYAADSAIDDQTYENYNNSGVSCGYNKNKEALISNIPESIPNVTHILYLGIEVAVPVILVVLGMIDLFKGISAQKEDEMKKGQQTFVKRLIPAVLIFLILLVIKIFIGFVADKNSGRIVSCVECFINNDCN